jgi:hypothetical protein
MFCNTKPRLIQQEVNTFAKIVVAVFRMLPEVTTFVSQYENKMEKLQLRDPDRGGC